jgi:hypothetical protein
MGQERTLVAGRRTKSFGLFALVRRERSYIRASDAADDPDVNVLSIVRLDSRRHAVQC